MAEEDKPGQPSPGSSRPTVRGSSIWRKLIQRNLRRTHEKVLDHGRLDPFRFLKEEEIKVFYSNHSPHPDRMIDNQIFARWAIEEALREYLADTPFEITGGIMLGKSVKMNTGKQKALQEITETIKAESQREIDAEDPNGPKETDSEVVQGVGTIAQCIIAASPNSLGPPVEASAMYLRMKKCGEYGRNKLAIWQSPLFPKLDGQEGRRGFLDNQITAIVWILSRFLGELPRLKIKRKELWDATKKRYIQEPETQIEKENREKLRGPKYFGGILADSMGLGKTLTTIATLDILASQRLNVPIEDGKARYRPILILTPNTTVATQWMDEINLIGSERGIKQIIISGHGFQKREDQKRDSRERGGQDRVCSLTRNEFDTAWPSSLSYVWDEDNFLAAKTVIIMSIDTFSGRTCSVLKDENGNETWTSTYADMRRRFSVVVIDEAYKVRNTATRNWKSVALLKRQFTLLITATPCQNHITDLLGPIQMLWDNPQGHLSEKGVLEDIQAIFTDPHDLRCLDNLSPRDDRYLIAGSPALLAKLIYKFRGSSPIDIQETRKFLKYFESLAILRRAPSSRLNVDWESTKQISLEGLLPTVDNYTVNIQRDEAIEKEYQEIHINLLIDYLKAVSNWRKTKKDADVKPVLCLHRLFQLAAASLDVHRLDKLFARNGFGTLSQDVHAMRKANVNFMHLSPFLLEKHDSKPKVALDYIKLAVRKSPILRYILYYIKENLLGRGPNGKIKKLLITEASPMLAYYYELVLQFLLIHCRTLHAGLSSEERRELIADFNSDSDHSCQVLIQMYTVGFAGSNLHKSCSQVIVASQAFSLSVQSQAVHRVIRVGQESDVTVHRLKVNNSFHSFRESRQVEKILPELGTRAQGSMNDVLVQVLNLFQSEIDEVWKTPEAQKLIADEDLISSPMANYEEPDSKRIKLEDGSAVQTEAAREQHIVRIKLPLKRKRERDEHDISTTGLFRRRRGDFLALKSRSDYYKEFKEFPMEVRGYFCHKKNNLRRMLSYGSEDNNATTRVWAVEDLNDSPVLERAMELILRIRLGANNIEMLPLPQIDFSLAPPRKLKELAGLLSETKAIEQDIQVAQDADAKKSKKDKGLAVLKVMNDRMPMHELEQMLKDNAFGNKYSKTPSSTSTAPRIMNEDSEAEEEDDDEKEDFTRDGSSQPRKFYADDDEKDDLWERLGAASGSGQVKTTIEDSDELTFLSSQPVRKAKDPSHNPSDLVNDESTRTKIKREDSVDSMTTFPNDGASRRKIKEESPERGVSNVARPSDSLTTDTHESIVIEISDDDDDWVRPVYRRIMGYTRSAVGYLTPGSS
ncbi:SNF2 family N-terminal domain-containing protein [Daldinia vernicosa]|uniref:SNF2 family N-terminal domain-containing protein n=1 Tax=Daldinia vernicosa TaxID=114800 RepID=UPI002008CE6F|nr:SNF2 family N-terminal domain-containing protein [Daldinia vernicosa]KAI0845982.1 SNF2 family N-terminal domain-containing protein [Daldinia vernicosa]